MKRRLLIPLLFLTFACKDKASIDAKDKEIAELKAKLQPHKAASLGAAKDPQPSLAPGKAEAEPDEPEQPSEAGKALVAIANRIRAAAADPEKMAALLAEANDPEVRKITYAHLKKNANCFGSA